MAASPCNVGVRAALLRRSELFFDRNPQHKQHDPVAHPRGVSLSDASEEKIWCPSLSKSSFPPLLSLPLPSLLSSISLYLLLTPSRFQRLMSYLSPRLSSSPTHTSRTTPSTALTMLLCPPPAHLPQLRPTLYCTYKRLHQEASSTLCSAGINSAVRPTMTFKTRLPCLQSIRLLP